MSQTFCKVNCIESIGNSKFLYMLSKFGKLILRGSSLGGIRELVGDKLNNQQYILSNRIRESMGNIGYYSVYQINDKTFVINGDASEIRMINSHNGYYDSICQMPILEVIGIYAVKDMEGVSSYMPAANIYTCFNGQLLVEVKQDNVDNYSDYIHPILISRPTERNGLIARISDTEEFYRITPLNKSRIEFKKMSNKLLLTANTKMYENIAKYSDALMYDTLSNTITEGYLIYTLFTDVNIFMEDISDISIDPVKISPLITVEGIVVNDRLYILQPDGVHKFIDFTKNDFTEKTYIIPGIFEIAAESEEVFVACPEEGCYKLKEDNTPVSELDVASNEVVAFDQGELDGELECRQKQDAERQSSALTKIEQLDSTVNELCNLLRGAVSRIGVYDTLKHH